MAELPNIMTNPSKKGNFGKALFSDPPYCTICSYILLFFTNIKDDFYIDPFRKQ